MRTCTHPCARMPWRKCGGPRTACENRCPPSIRCVPGIERSHQICRQVPLSAIPSCQSRNLICFPFSSLAGTQTLVTEGRPSPSHLPSSCLSHPLLLLWGTPQLPGGVHWNGLRTLASWDAKVPLLVPKVLWEVWVASWRMATSVLRLNSLTGLRPSNSYPIDGERSHDTCISALALP